MSTVLNHGFSVCGKFRIWNIEDVGCSESGMIWIWNLGKGMLAGM